MKKYDIGEVTITYPDSSMEVKVNQDGSILITPKKVAYPKTLEECFSIVLNCEKQESIRTNFSGTYKKSLEGLYELLIARKAYWEIYRKLNNIDEDVLLYLTDYVQKPNEDEENSLEITLSNKKYQDKNIRTIADKLKEGAIAMKNLRMKIL